MNQPVAQHLLTTLHRAQAAHYAGADPSGLPEILTADVAWHVPGRNAIAGDYQGIAAVLAYFDRRRRIAGNTMRMQPREILMGSGSHIASLTDGTATIRGTAHRWSTVGLYRIRGSKIAECWLLPLDAEAFDRIWAAGRASSYSTLKP
jgi:ketosteroid isomerase-like protein